MRGILPRGGTILGSSRTNPFNVEGRPPGAPGAAPLDDVIAAGSTTAQAHTYEAQRGLWRTFFDGFVG